MLSSGVNCTRSSWMALLLLGDDDDPARHYHNRLLSVRHSYRRETRGVAL
jgi:hypothetical protein